MHAPRIATPPRFAARLPDIIAGISIAGLLLPEAVAYSGIGNLPPEAGVVGLFAGLVVYAVCGGSRFAIVSATSSSAAVLAASVAALMGDGNAADLRIALAAGLTLLTGALFIASAAARFGNLSDFIAKPVLRGFSFGLAIVIIVKQWPKVVSLHTQSGDPLPLLWELLARLREWNPWGLCTGLLALLLLSASGRFRRVPGALIAIALGIASEHWLHLSAHGVGLVGDIRVHIGIPALPRLPWIEWLHLGEAALAMMLVLYAESYSSIRGFALKHGDAFAPNRELLALGLANLASGLIRGMPVGAGYSATSANEAAGAQSKLTGGIAAALILVLVMTLLPMLALTPEPVLAAIVIHAVGHTLDPRLFKPYLQWRRDLGVLSVSIAAVLLLGVLDGLLLAIAVSLAVMLKNLAQTRVSILGQWRDSHDFVALNHHPDAKPIAGALIVRPEAPLFFANAERMLGEVRGMAAGRGDLRTVILSLEESPDLDSTSIEALIELAIAMAAQNRTLLLARLKDRVLHALQRADIATLPDAHMNFHSVDDAVASITENANGH